MHEHQPVPPSGPAPPPPAHWPTRTRALAGAIAAVRQAAEDEGELDPSSAPWPLLWAAERLVRDAAGEFAGPAELAGSAEEATVGLLIDGRRAWAGDVHAERALALARARVEDALQELREARDAFLALERAPLPLELVERAERELRAAGSAPAAAFEWVADWWLRRTEGLKNSRPADVWGSGAPELQEAVRRQLEQDMRPHEGFA